MHEIPLKQSKILFLFPNKSFDSVKAAFIEGEPLYPGSVFRRQNHIQIAIVNPNCIKGIFLPREEVSFPSDDYFSWRMTTIRELKGHIDLKALS